MSIVDVKVHADYFEFSNPAGSPFLIEQTVPKHKQDAAARIFSTRHAHTETIRSKLKSYIRMQETKSGFMKQFFFGLLLPSGLLLGNTFDLDRDIAAVQDEVMQVLSQVFSPQEYRIVEFVTEEENMAESLQQKLQAAADLVDAQPANAVPLLKDILMGSYPNDAESLKVKESALDMLAGALVQQKDSAGLRALLTDLRSWFGVIPKAKTAKIVRTIIDSIGKIPDSTQILLEVCKEQAAWATSEKRTFLRQRIDVRLATLYLTTRDYPASLAPIGTLLTEVKRLDDKLLLVEIHLLESKVHSALRNLPKSRAALTAARTAANAVYVAPSLQADIDTQSGILHAEEKDFKTGYSYFYEAFEQLSALDDVRAVAALKYMLLCKIMSGEVNDVAGIISSKGGLKYAGTDVDALRAVSKAYHDRSLGEFQAALETYRAQLQDDPVVHSHLSALYGMLLEQNLMRLIEPYSRVQVAHVASLIKLPVGDVEAKLSQMILDKKFAGTLDQGVGTLEVFDEAPEDPLYPSALETMENMSRVVDNLFARSARIAS